MTRFNEIFSTGAIAFMILVALLFASLFLVSVLYIPTLVVTIFIGMSIALMIIAIYGGAKQLGEFDKWASGETHSVLYQRISKDIEILDEKGNAIIRYDMECKRTPNATLKQVVHEIFHDGKAELLEVTLNGASIKAEKEEFVIRKKENGEKLIPQPYRMKIKIFFPADVPKQDFRYSYTTRYNEVYPHMDEKDKEFTSHRVILPTFWIKFTMRLPQNSNMSFLRDAVVVRAFDEHEVEDFSEDKRIEDKYPLIVSKDDKTIIWELQRPKIAYTYKMFFCVKKKRL